MSEIEVDEYNPVHNNSNNNDTGRMTSTLPIPSSSSSSSLFLQQHHRRYDTVQQYITSLHGTTIIEKVLIANNGVAAVKAIRSIRRWAYDVFGNERAITFVVMATPEDLRANAEYIRMAEVIVDVPGGSNNHNYANVTLIVELARLHGVHAVWAGWGHASENPTLPDTLAQSHPPIKFIGPSGPPMRALGDKIGSTIIAQSANVPCIGWNGQHVIATYNKETGTLPQEAFDAATIQNATQAEAAANAIGFPIMIKASEGGGGKGIRRVDHIDNVANAFRQVCGEVPGSPIFIMKLSSNSRHLEVQLLADEYGNAIALNGRDCSVQRRHQKIIEEGPPIAAPAHVWKQMEQAAVALAQAVQYSNAGTVEYLYSEKESKFYFLELNPRLQVEHPVTEMITRVNLPAAQLQVAMGIPLYNIPDIRELYGRNRFEDDPSAESSKIDFTTAQRVPPNGHCIAVRITAENAEAGFKPTSGGIQELNFRSTPNVWGYFSMDSSGSIHEFADSQFGHLFANGSDREHARRNMVLALKELSIRGDISTTVDYISKLIELDDFIANRIDTSWLDGIIQANVDGMGTAEKQQGSTRYRASVNTQSLSDHMYVILASTICAYDACTSKEKQFMDLLDKGQLPPRSLLSVKQPVELILSKIKYKLCCTRSGPNTFSITLVDGYGKLDNSGSTNNITTSVRVLSDGGYLIEVGGTSHVAYVASKPDTSTGMRMNVGGKNVVFSPDYDPTALRTDVAGKLVKKLKPDNAYVKKGEAYCEIEVMKMFMPLKVEESGTLHWQVNEGAAISAGDLLASIVLDNPDNVAKVSVFDGVLSLPDTTKTGISTSDSTPHLVLRTAIEKLDGVISGYLRSSDAIESIFLSIASAVTRPYLPVIEVKEQLSVLSGRIPSSLSDNIMTYLDEFSNKCNMQAGSGVELRFPAEEISSLISNHAASIDENNDRISFLSLTAPLSQTVLPYTKSKLPGIPGSERALQSFLLILRKWISIERWFCDGRTYADAIDGLRKANKDDPASVLAICRAHEQLKTTSEIVIRIISLIGDSTRIDFQHGAPSAIGKRVSIVAGAESLPLALPVISEIGSMGGSDKYYEVALCARKLLMQESMPSLEQRKQRVTNAAEALSSSTDSKLPRDVAVLIGDNIPINDVFFSILQTYRGTVQEVGLLELYLRNVYRPYTIKDFHRDEVHRLVKFNFLNRPSESAINVDSSLNSMTDLSRIVSSSSLSKMSDSSERSFQYASKIPSSTLRNGVCAVIESLEDLSNAERFESIMAAFPQRSLGTAKFGPANVLYFVVLDTVVDNDKDGDNNIVKQCELVLEKKKENITQADIRRVTFLFKQQCEDEFDDFVPALFTFRTPDYREDSLYRRIDPSLSMHLHLHRVSSNFHIRSLGSRHTSTCHVHLYEATPRSSSVAKDRKANTLPRIFARTLSFMVSFSSSRFETILVDALNAFDLCTLKSRSDNHLFLNLVSDVENSVIDPVVVEQAVVEILKRHSERVSGLGIVEVETRIVCCLSTNTPPIAIRLFASNPTGYVHVMNTYVEAANETGDERVFKLISGTKASLASAGDSSWDGLKINTPYPLTRPFDAQRKLAMSSSDTIYCYDLPALFEAAVEKQWLEMMNQGTVDGGINATGRPLMVMFTTELVVQKKGGSISDKWTMRDYMLGNLELVNVNRRAGLNDVGMVAWAVTLKTVEYPNGRQIVLIANDITHKAGSFGTREDVVFKLASEYAREKRIPRLFIAANSGARIGLADRVKQKFKVAFKDPSKPENGFEFLYVSKTDYLELVKPEKEVIVEPAEYNGEEVFRITDIIGSEPDLGVENLKGSGLIAGETCVAYDDIFTLTIVLGRTVGIGAYLVRLGQRTIQKTSNSPIILTGYQALNKLMGTDVYSTNDQLGGPGIMYPNGISHLIESDHLRAVKAAMDWLSFVPSVRGGLLPVSDIRGIDEIERPVEFTPMKGIPYDPRHLLAGATNDTGEWKSGFFDKGSFHETLAGWAKTVVVGRARLGGIPMGVIITENRTAEAIKPADPADVKASEAIIQEAGCVWFPNSAYKTAQAIKDFRSEDLPLIVFANWRGFSGGQRDMFDEVLKYGSLIVDAFVSYKQPVFVFIPPHAEIRGGAWVVLDASINASVMEMYAAKGTARGGVLEANGAASVKYRTKDLITTMHRLDDQLIDLDGRLTKNAKTDVQLEKDLQAKVLAREQILLPVYEQISVQFCELHDTPGRMKAVGVIEKEVDWGQSRSFFYWRLRRKLAEFDLRKQLREASELGRGVTTLTPLESTQLIKKWFIESQPQGTDFESKWSDDKEVLNWMSSYYSELENKILLFTRDIVAQEVLQVLTAGGNTAKVGLAGIAEGLRVALEKMPQQERDATRKLLLDIL